MSVAACYFGVFYYLNRITSCSEKKHNCAPRWCTSTLMDWLVMDLNPKLFTGSSWWFISHTHTSGLGGGFFALCEMKSLNLSIKFCFRRQIKISAEQRATNVEGHKRKWVMITRSFLLPYSANTHTGNTHRRVHIHTDQPTDKQVAITSVAREYWTSVTGPM